jgi:hypothetical protein
MNGAWAKQAALALAENVNRMDAVQELSQRESQIAGCFQAVFQREPTAIESEQCQLFLKTRSMAELCLVLLNSNEFTFVE